MSNLKFLSLFSGIGAFEKALTNLEIPYELVGFSEIDKYAIKSYCAIHDVDETLNLGSVTEIDSTQLEKDIDLLTYGFPCTDISLAGKQQGFFNADGTQTRSGLFFEALKIIEDVKPKIAIAENVKNLTSKKFSSEFKIVLQSLEEAGYNNYWKVLDAKDYGNPQHRERVFIISIRKDCDDGAFDFPKESPLKLHLKDLMDKEVDEKFYLTNTQIERIFSTSYNQGNRRIQKKQWCDTLCARDYKDPLCIEDENQRVRKITPKEYFLLMGFSSVDFELAQSQNSNTQLYKQAGNSIVVNVLEAIFNELYKSKILK